MRLRSSLSPSSTITRRGRGRYGVKKSELHSSLDPLQGLADCAMGFQDGRPVIHNAGQVGIGEADSVERRAAENFSRSGLSVFAKEESGLRAEICVSPTVQYDARNVAAGVKSQAAEHQVELFTDFLFVAAKGRSDQ